MRSVVVAALLLLAVTAPAPAQDKPPAPPAPAPAPPPKPLTTEQAADAVLAAVAAKDAAALKALAAKDDPDPWLVAEELCARGRFGDAEAFAKAAPRKDVEKLPVFVAARRNGPSPLEPIARSFARAEESRDGGRDKLRDATEAYIEAADGARAVGWIAREARARNLAGGCAMDRGDFPAARVCWHDRLVLEEARGSREGVARACANLGVACRELGESALSFEYEERALEGARALGNRQLEAVVLLNIGNSYQRARDYERGATFLTQALAAATELGATGIEAACLGNLGLDHWSMGRFDEALEFQKRALVLLRELGDESGVDTTLGNMALVLRASGKPEEALTVLEEVLERQRRADDRPGIAVTLGSIGSVHYQQSRYPQALDYKRQAVELARELGDADTEAVHLSGMSGVLLQLERFAEAADAAKRSLEISARLATGLADEQGAMARQGTEEAAVFGAYAARRLDDPVVLCWFLESGRAGALTESLQARHTLQGAVLSTAVREEESAAREKEAGAVRALRSATDGGDLAEVRAARTALDAARTGVQAAIERIQRTAKSAASIVHPVADPLDAIRGRLREGEALVLYGLTDQDAVALVVSATGARIVGLGPPQAVCDACAAVVPDRQDADPVPAIANLRKLIVDPLGLDDGTKCVLVAPEGALSYVPFALLLGARDVAYVPSGTVHGLLLDDAAKHGDGVLALGDPDYDAKPTDGVVAVRGGGYGNLVRLPATGAEAKAVGDVVLLGKDATESGLRDAVAKKPRWRAVHLACHGLVDPERPMFSSLALTPSGDDDGFLTALEVFRMKCPADLVVLSACETGKGKVYKAEGIVGLTRAFMFAGAPRVLVSLWKVDDEATGALMKKFYELWNPKDGKGVPAARALRDAQTFIRSQEKWKHPRYWAAWVLWGLPD